MKKFTLVFTVLLCLWYCGLHAQGTFAPVGAEWYYAGDRSYYEPFPLEPVGERWIDHVQSVKDTIVLDIPCRKLEMTRYLRSRSDPSELFISRDVRFIYDNTDTVFVFDRFFHRFIPLYIFNAQEHDTICLPIAHDFAPDEKFCFVIESIRTEVYDTSHLRSFYTHALPLPGRPNSAINWGMFGSWGYSAGRYTERLGGNFAFTSGLFPSFAYNNPDAMKEIGVPSGVIRCYNDPEYAIKTGGTACDLLPPYLDIQEAIAKKRTFSLYPNPGDGLLHISLSRPISGPVEITLFDLAGKVLMTRTLIGLSERKTLDLSCYPSGIYLCRIHFGTENFYQKVVIRR